MSALSQQQQKLMGLALAYKRGDVPDSEVSGKIKKLANAMSQEELEKYASTKHKGLPKKVSQENKSSKITKEELNQLVADAVEEVMSERFSVKKLTPEQKQTYIEAISNYKNYGNTIYRSNDLPKVVSEIKTIVEFASKNMIEESGDWFEGISHSRNSKQLKESMREFEKLSEKITKLQKNLESIYESIGQHLSRFYEVKNKQ